ncbi:hypothetical protein BC829DRAFT_441414 [Chytridium lagenaria]|nr:hypothetical protein BC829DRAFT_441414 [Chytridium lagenaria]
MFLIADFNFMPKLKGVGKRNGGWLELEGYRWEFCRPEFGCSRRGPEVSNLKGLTDAFHREVNELGEAEEADIINVNGNDDDSLRSYLEEDARSA